MFLFYLLLVNQLMVVFSTSVYEDIHRFCFQFTKFMIFFSADVFFAKLLVFFILSFIAFVISAATNFHLVKSTYLYCLFISEFMSRCFGFSLPSSWRSPGNSGKPCVSWFTTCRTCLWYVLSSHSLSWVWKGESYCASKSKSESY